MNITEVIGNSRNKKLQLKPRSTWKRNSYKNEHHRSHWEQQKQEIAVKAPKMMKIGTWNVRMRMKKEQKTYNDGYEETRYTNFSARDKTERE
ncbi:hypothetical protein QE152_g21753 [Popillia japonica]|uniref:Uncharacterized protein n=1 Tax=Popillia japonica TaxID=7064 RepID=A0AAW1KMM8_POPJA